MTKEREYLDTIGDEELSERLSELSAFITSLQDEIDIATVEMKLIYYILHNRRLARQIDEIEESGKDL